MFIEHDRSEQAFSQVFKEPEKEKRWGVWGEGMVRGMKVAHFLMDDDGKPHFTPSREEAEIKAIQKEAEYQLVKLILGSDIDCTFSVKEAPE